jgi:hypothetical protein
MKKTEKRYWVNGHQVRGGWFHTFNFQIFNIGIMIDWKKKSVGFTKKTNIYFFKLV